MNKQRSTLKRELKCSVCGSVFFRYPSQITGVYGTFCGRSCAAKIHFKRIADVVAEARLKAKPVDKGLGGRPQRREWRTCTVCGNKFLCHICDKDRHMCSSSCYTHKRRTNNPLIGKERPDRRGVNHHNWKGGVTPINEQIRKSNEYRKWRRLVVKRDGRRCVLCSDAPEKIHVDHIKPFALFPELRFDVNNGRVLCPTCHRKTDTYGFSSAVYKQAL